MTELSPAAQAVLNAINKELDEAPWDLSFLAGASAAAALRAAADQVVPEEELAMNARGTRHWHRAIQRAETRSELLAIAAELRGDTATTETP